MEYFVYSMGQRHPPLSDGHEYTQRDFPPQPGIGLGLLEDHSYVATASYLRFQLAD